MKHSEYDESLQKVVSKDRDFDNWLYDKTKMTTLDFYNSSDSEKDIDFQLDRYYDEFAKEKAKTYLNSLDLKNNQGYFILSENSNYAVGFSPTAPNPLVVWQRDSDGDYRFGKYLNSLSSDRLKGLEREGIEIGKVKDILSNIDDRYIVKTLENISVKGHQGTWYEIDSTTINGETYFLMEHETYGDETAGIIIDSEHNLVVDEVYNGFDEESFKDFIDEKQFPNFNKIVEDEIVKEVQKELDTPIINLFAGPGAGKSTSAWEIASTLKLKGL
ncbi:MAG: hypothetical protein RSE93_08215, partial [Oscillospiraceae bacterium]